MLSTPAIAPAKYEPPRHTLSEDQLRVWRRFLGGIVGGVLLAATSHPFDTVKSRVQNSTYPSVIVCMRETFRRERLRGFYRGVTPPLIMGGVNNSLLFSLNQHALNLITPVDHDPTQRHPLWRTGLAAQLTAPLYVLALTPMEKVKVQMQLECSSPSASNTFACVRRIIHSEGWRGLLSGYGPTLMSRLVGLPFYFSGYQVANGALMETRVGGSQMGREVLVPMLSGVMAGVCFWTSNYPFDFVKTQVQASQTRVTVMNIILTNYTQGGIRIFYRGFSACLLRSIPANASVWLGVEFTTRYMTNHGW